METRSLKMLSDSHVSAEQALAAAFTHRATEQEQREIIMSNNNELCWQWFREL